MEYTIKKLGELAGVSARTLRYYDEIGLLKPCRINSSGYRIYGENEVDLLHQIMFYKSMDMTLEDIKNIVSNPHYDINKSLMEHRKTLLYKKQHLEQLISAIEKTIAYNKGEISMSNKEKFEVFKKQELDKNEDKYGEEIRNKYGNDVIDKSNNKFLNLTEEQYNEMNKVEDEIIKMLVKISETNDLDSEEAKEIYEKHQQWLKFTMPIYSKEIHKSLAEMYVLDERFAKYYNDKAGIEVVENLKKIILKYAK